MVTATQRVSEYESMAKGLMSQAAGKQAEAKSLAEHMAGHVAMGDKVAEAEMKQQIDGLLANAKSLEAEAKKFYGIAEKTRKTIPEFQNAGNMAAARINYEYTHTFTPPPSS